jgi:HAD superfamily hydrolase (TIGR01509 family)
MNKPLDPNRVQGLLFDIDGTLADTDDEFVRQLARLLAPLSARWPRLKPAATARTLVMAAESPINSLMAWWDRLFLDELVSPAARLLPRRRRPAKSQQLIPGVRAMLDEAHDRYRLGIVTARGPRITASFLDGSNLAPWFDVTVHARTVRRTKPHPAPVLWAAAQLDLDPSQCLMVGDTTPDIVSGAAAGAQTIGVLCGFGERDELLRAGANLVIDSTADLLTHLGPT